jgi:methionyl-tRNA formyltransferase
MRIAIITQEEPFYLPTALDNFCQVRHQDIVAIIILPSFNEKITQTAYRLYRFYGPFDFIRLAGRFIRIKFADFLQKNNLLKRPYSIMGVGYRYKIPIYKIAQINHPETLKLFQLNIKPDLIISIAASQIFKKEILNLPPCGCINLHSSPLPRYQGMMPSFWAMLSGEKETAVTVHYMVEDLDAGDIILQMPVPIFQTDSLHDLMMRAKQAGVQALLAAVNHIEEGTVNRQKMNLTKASYFHFPTRTDAKALRNMGHALL